jgi:hypothetical protein
MEKNAAQRWAFQYEFFRDWCSTRGVQLREHETTSNKLDPQLGVWATLPAVWRYNRVRLPGDRTTASRAHVQPFVREVTSYPASSSDDLIMSQWFGEYWLSDLIGSQYPTTGSMHRHIPSWLRGHHPHATFAQTRIIDLAARQQAS